MTDALTAFLEAAVRTATPLALAALGELLVERAGIINIGLEGALIAGAFGAFVGASTAGTTGGYAAAIAAGLVISLVFALCVVGLRANQIIAGTAVTLLALGLTGTFYQAFHGEVGESLTIPTSRPFSIPLLASIPVLGSAFFAQPVITYAGYVLFPLLGWWIYRTRAGLALRAIGERPQAADAAGIKTDRVRVTMILLGGAMGGLAGATLVLTQAGTFAEGMSAGRGFIAIAIVALGRWHPTGVAIAALLFGSASASQFLFQAMGWTLPYQLFLALPYAVTLVALTRLRTRGSAPASLAQ